MSRLLRLLSLLQTRRDWSGAELAERLEITPRTVRRDIDPGCAASATRCWPPRASPATGWPRRPAPAAARRRRSRRGRDGPAHGRWRFDHRHRGDLSAGPGQARTGTAVPTAPPDQRPAVGDGADGQHRPYRRPGTLTAIAAACRDSLRLRFDYRTHDGTSSIRTTEPHRLVHTGRRWYLIGWDVDRRDWRTYRVDRLDPRTPTGPRFTPRTPPDPDISGYTSRAISTSAYRYQARFTLHVSAETAAERIAPTTGALEPIDEHSCTLRAGSNSLDELAIYVTTKGFDFQVHEPPELVEHVRTLAARLAGATD